MKIFYRRPLSLILCIMLGGFSVFSFSDTKFKYLLFVIPCLVLAVSLFNHSKIVPHKALLRISALCLFFSMLFSHIYIDRWYRADKRFEENVEIIGDVTSITENDYSADIDIECDSINSKPFSSYKLHLTVSKKGLKNYQENTKISFNATLSDFTNDTSDFNLNSYYYSRGYSAEIKDVADIEVIGTTDKDLEAVFTELRLSISEYIVEISDEKSGGLLAALLLGEKSFLQSQLGLDFYRIGITHMLALSGMNLTILILGFSKLLSALGVGKKVRYVINIILTVFYLALTGFPLSVVRAGVMLIITSLLFLFAGARDSVTALISSVFLICLVNPYSIFDIGLWLSAFATLGIVILAEIPKAKAGKKNFLLKILHSVKGAFLVTAFAVSATFAITVFSFDEISVASPFATFIFSFPLEIYLYLGIIAMIFGKFTHVGRILVFCGELIADFTGFLSDFEFVSASSDYLIIKILTAVFSILFFTFLIINVKAKRLAATLLSCFLFSIFGIAMILGINVKNHDTLSYRNIGGSDFILALGEGDATLIDSSSYSLMSAFDSLSIVEEAKITLIENYVITDYSDGLPLSLSIVLSRIAINKIYLPQPQGEVETAIYNECLKLKENFRTSFIAYNENAEYKISSTSFKMSFRKPMSTSGTLNIYTVQHSDRSVTYLSSGILRDETKNKAIAEILKADSVIFGKHGAKYTNYSFAYKFENLRFMMIASKNVYIQSSLFEYYKQNGTEIYLSAEAIEFIH